jgi:fucose permease
MRTVWRPGLLLSLAWVGFVGLGVRSGLLGVAWPSIRADFDVPLDALGALLGPGSVGYLLGSFVSGRALARWELSVLLAVGFAGVAVNLVGTAVAPSWWMLLALGLPGGLGAGLIDAGLNTYVTNRHGAREMNWLHASWGVGATCSPFLMTAAIASGLGWRWGYAVPGLVLLGLGGAYLVTRAAWPSRAEMVHQVSPETTRPGPSTLQPELARRGATMWQTLRLSVTWLSMLLFIAYTGVELGIGQWAFPFLVTERGMGTVEAGAAVSAYWAGVTLGRVFFGGLVAAIGIERLLQACLLSVLVLLCLLWVPTAPWTAFAVLALLGVVQAPVYPALVTLTPSHFGSAHTPNAVGFQVAASVVGGAGLPALIGVLAQAFGLETIVPTLVVAGALEIVCYLAWSRSHREQDLA